MQLPNVLCEHAILIGSPYIQPKCGKHTDTTLRGSCSTWKLTPYLGGGAEETLHFKTLYFFLEKQLQ